MKQSAWLALAVLATLWLLVAILIDVATNTIAEIAVQGGWAPVGKSQPLNDPIDDPPVPPDTIGREYKPSPSVSHDPKESAKSQLSITKPAGLQPPETGQH